MCFVLYNYVLLQCGRRRRGGVKARKRESATIDEWTVQFCSLEVELALSMYA